MSTHSSKVADLEKQIAANQRKAKRLRKSLEDCAAEGFSLDRRLRRERLRLLIGEPVILGHRRPDHPELNDTTGTLLEVRRTRCTVDFGTYGKWTMPIEEVAPPETEQGMFVPFGGVA